LRRSRITKALIDRAAGPATFDAAEERLDNVGLVIVLPREHVAKPAAQAAVLTAAVTGVKCFGAAHVMLDGETPLYKALPFGYTLGTAAAALGATVSTTMPRDATHVLMIGDGDVLGTNIFVRCWWNRWIAGVLPPWDRRALGESGNPLAGIFSGALAVREVFATVLNYPRAGSRVSIASLWEPDADPKTADLGPATVFMPPRLWLVGLGHLGQGYAWSLGLLRASGIEAVLQDDQCVGEENEATGLLVRRTDVHRKRRKTRIVSDWLSELGWSTRLIERRHYGDIRILLDDPRIVVTGLDEPDARIKIAKAGFEYMIDAGIGHGPVDFEGAQLRVLDRSADVARLWSRPVPAADVESPLKQNAYLEYAKKIDECGTVALANASVAVPFVGAAVGAMTIAQVLRVASMQETSEIMQLELGSPAMTLMGCRNTAPTSSLGSVDVPSAA